MTKIKKYIFFGILFLIFVKLGVVVLASARPASSKEGKDHMSANPLGKIKIFHAATGQVEEVDRVIKTDEEWKKILSSEQFRVIRRHGTEGAFTGQYHDSKKKGVYQCLGCGTDLFGSEAKFDSGTGWPSYWQPISEHNIGYQVDNSLFMRRIEVHCARCGAHLGHVFDDGPPPTHKRYCINSVSLKFLPAERR